MIDNKETVKKAVPLRGNENHQLKWEKNGNLYNGPGPSQTTIDQKDFKRGGKKNPITLVGSTLKKKRGGGGECSGKMKGKVSAKGRGE